MPDIKIKPQMETPKVRVVNNTPKDANTILKKDYMAQQRNKQPEQKDPVGYATDRVEITERCGTVAAADGMRRMVKGQMRSGHPKIRCQENTADTAEYPLTQYYPPKLAESGDLKIGFQETVAEAVDYPQSQRYQPKTGTPGDLKIRSPEKALQTSQNPPELTVQTGLASPMPKERGRRKAIEDAKTTRQKARNLAEKENIIAPHSTGAKAEGRQIAKSHTAAAKRGTATPKSSAPVPLKQTAAQRAKQIVQTKRQRKMLAQTAAKAKQCIKTGTQELAHGVMVVGRSAAAAVSSILAAGGGLALFLVLLVVIVIGAIATSPFGILFSEENATPDTVPVAAAVAHVHDDLNTQLAAIQTADSYDDITLVGSTPDWADVLAVFAVKVTGTDSLDAVDVVTIDANRIARLKNVFWDMCAVTPHVETTYHPDSDPDDEVDDSWTEKDLTITITAKTASEMASAYGFTVHQISVLDELLQQRDVLLELAGNLTAISAATSEVLKELPEDLPEDREAVIRVACSLVGKVNYFWGGKSLVIGWDDRWGALQKVWAEGSSTTGTYRPYGLDCSGFVDWVFHNATDGQYIIGHVLYQHNLGGGSDWRSGLFPQ